MQQPSFSENPICHVYNRGVEKRNAFLDKNDYTRFIHDLVDFNSLEPTLHPFSSPRILKSIDDFQSEQLKQPLVKILVFTLMPNHFHLLLQSVIENGIAKFMQKLGTGYTMYFNKKYERVGCLFQGTYKTITVIQEAHFIHLPFYIHANPLDNLLPQWREGKINNFKAAAEYLENYRWSSFRDYIGKTNYPAVTQREFLLEFFRGPQNYHKEFLRWLKAMDSIYTGYTDIDNFTLE